MGSVLFGGLTQGIQCAHVIAVPICSKYSAVGHAWTF